MTVSVYGEMTRERNTRIWTLWQQGVPISHIAQVVQKPPVTVYSYLLYHVGIEPKIRQWRESFFQLKRARPHLEELQAALACLRLLTNLASLHRLSPERSHVMKV